MYIYIVRRTQIYLGEELHARLDQLAEESGVTKSQLIRDAIEQAYLGGPAGDSLLRALVSSAGSWRRNASGERYVERMRTGRLARMHAAGRR